MSFGQPLTAEHEKNFQLGKKLLDTPSTETKFVSTSVGTDPDFIVQVGSTLTRTNSTKTGQLDAFSESTITIDSAIFNGKYRNSQTSCSMIIQVLDSNNDILFAIFSKYFEIQCNHTVINVPPVDFDPKFFDVAAKVLTSYKTGPWQFCDPARQIPPNQQLPP